VEYKIRAHSSPIPFQETKNQNLFLSGLLNQDDGKPTWFTFPFEASSRDESPDDPMDDESTTPLASSFAP